MKSARTEQAAPQVDAAISGWPPEAGRMGAHKPGSSLPCDFALTRERRGSGTAVLVLVGELDLYRAAAIEKALTEAIGPEPAAGAQTSGEEARRVVVDVRSVTFLDSTTLAMLLSASRRQQARGGELVVQVGPKTPMTAFEVTGFDRLLAIERVDDHPKDGAA
jgi:anti-anti-sigma factor